MGKQICNAKITEVSVEIEDHGCLTMLIGLNGGGWGAFFGGANLKGSTDLSTPDVTGYWIRRVLETLGSLSVSGLKDKPCRVKIEDGKVVAIGHFIEDKWFDPSEEFKDFN